MAVLVGEPHDLVFDGRATARPATLIWPEYMGAMQIAANDVVHRVVRVGDMAMDLRLSDPFGAEAEGPRIAVAGLFLQLGKINERPLSRQGVPVLNRASWKPQAVRLSLSASAV